MSLTAKALFVIERNLGHDLNLQGIAAACGVSRFHLAHAFAIATDRTVMDYVRARRLTEAARELVRGAPRILDVALAAGYQSHEAFSRAFRAQFDLTPERLREQGTLDELTLTESLSMTHASTTLLAAPAFRSAGELLFVGLAALRRMGDAAKIPAQWREFMSGPFRAIGSRLDIPPVGVTLPTEADEEFIYVCAAEVSRLDGTPAGLSEFRIPPCRYAVFEHAGHVSELPRLYAALWNEWFPASGERPLRAASLERHHTSFDPRTGAGGVSLWIPLAPAPMDHAQR